MSLVITIIAGAGAEPFLPDRVGEIRGALGAAEPDWLVPGRACDLLLTGGDAAAAETAARLGGSGVARAVGGSPSILLADEPTGNLDSKNGEAVMELLRELHREGATICMVTHDPRYARHADRSIHLFDGRVVEEDGSKKGERELEESGFDIAH